MRTIVLRIAALALLLLLVLVGALSLRTLQRLPNSIVYFVRSEPTSFVLEGVGRHTDGKTTEARLRQALGALVEGPTVAERARGLATTFPPDARLLDLSLQDGTLTVDMSGEFESGGGSATMIGRLNQLFYTATQPKDVQAVILEVEGEPVRLFGGEGLIVERPWRRPAEESLPVW